MIAKIKIDLYECEVIMQIVPTTKDVCTAINSLAKKRKQSLPNEIGDVAAGQVIGFVDKYYIILSKKHVKTLNTALHELWHCIEAICEDREIRDEEAKAYLQGFVGEKLIQDLIKYQNEQM